MVQDNWYISTEDGTIYEKIYDDFDDNIFEKVLSNVSEYRLYEYKEEYEGQFEGIPRCYNASALTNDSRLYVWGINWQGQIGNGECGYNFALYQNSDKFYDPYPVLENVREYRIDVSEKNYYKCAAITLNDELYVWGALPRIKDTITVNIGGGQLDYSMLTCWILTGIILKSFSVFVYGIPDISMKYGNMKRIKQKKSVPNMSKVEY